MDFVKRWQNDGLFKKHYALYQCNIDNCDTEKTIDIDPKNFDESDIIKCSKCGLYSNLDKTERISKEILKLEEKLAKLKVELEMSRTPK